jgi:lysozyme
MVITRSQADMLLREALKVRYEPSVAMAMTNTDGAIMRPAQHEFDAGVSFQWNTGAIARATWVKLWKAKSPRPRIRLAMLEWSKAGGRVLPALRDRRNRETDMLLDGVYRVAAPAAGNVLYAAWGLALAPDEVRAVFEGLAQLGYKPGGGTDRVLRAAVERFQQDHALTVDGIIGRATLSTLQRALDARAKATAPVTAALVSPAAAYGLADQFTGVPHLDAAPFAAAALWLLSHAWAYRDVLASVIAPAFPRAAALLRAV